MGFCYLLLIFFHLRRPMKMAVAEMLVGMNVGLSVMCMGMDVDQIVFL